MAERGPVCQFFGNLDREPGAARDGIDINEMQRAPSAGRARPSARISAVPRPGLFVDRSILRIGNVLTHGAQRRFMIERSTLRLAQHLRRPEERVPNNNAAPDQVLQTLVQLGIAMAHRFHNQFVLRGDRLHLTPIRKLRHAKSSVIF